jgi:CheY-like chemotaxis protein
VASPPRAAKVVVIDDSVSVCRAIERMLRPRGLAVLGVHSAGEAVDRLESENPDLVICDMVLPDAHGLEVCRFVRASEALGRVPLLVVSGLADPRVRAEALAAGADAVLYKPFSSGDLTARVEVLLGLQEDPGGAAEPAPPEVPWPAAAQVAWRELAGLPALRGGSFRDPRGTVVCLGGSGTTPAPEPLAILVPLRTALTGLELDDPELVLIEDARGGMLILAHHPERGTLAVHLGDRLALGKARHLARTFLRAWS